MLCMSGLARSVPEASVHPAVRLSLAACLVARSSDSYYGSESELPCVLPMHTSVTELRTRAANAFNLNSLRSQSVSRRPSSLALHARFHGLAEVESS